jgi:dTDP-4-dehydrorhamnose reductase
VALIVGASGQVGYHLALAAERRGLPWAGTFHSSPRAGLRHLDIRDAAAVARLVQAAKPKLILLPAAFANVDRCESEPRKSYAINVLGTKHLVDAANEARATIVYFSSDYIFDGLDGPYDELAPVNPLSRYGVQKLSAEHLILQRANEALIVRTTVVYGPEPQEKNFIYRLLNTLRKQENIAVAADQVGTPTYAPTLAEAVYDLLKAGVRGVINVAGRDLVARDTFAREAASIFGEDPKLVQPVSTAELQQMALRPLNGGLCSVRAEERLERELPGYIEGLRRLRIESTI